MCVPNSDQNNSCLRMSSPFLFNIGKVRHFNTVKNQIRQKPGICGLLTRVHTEVYVEKHPSHCYGNQLCLQLVYDVTQAQYTSVHAVSSLQHLGAWGMSLDQLEASSFKSI